MPRERTVARKLEASRQVRRRCAALRVKDMVRPRYDVSGTSQRTKSHQCAFAHLSEANVCTPRPTSSRVTTADGRSPGLRVVTLRRLPRTEIPSGVRRRIRRLQLRGQPRNWGNFPRTAFPFDPQAGTVENYGRSLSKSESIPLDASYRSPWTSASFLPHGHTCCTGAGWAVQQN